MWFKMRDILCEVPREVVKRNFFAPWKNVGISRSTVFYLSSLVYTFIFIQAYKPIVLGICPKTESYITYLISLQFRHHEDHNAKWVHVKAQE